MTKIKSIINGIKMAGAPSTVFFGFIITSLVILAMLSLGNLYTLQRLDHEWSHVISAYDTGVREAKLLDDQIVEVIHTRVIEVYLNQDDKLKEDLKNIHLVNDLTTILDEAVTDKWLLGIQNDNNDPFIMNRDRIITDKSYNCSSDQGVTRTLSDEIYKAGGTGHFNSSLATKALSSIITGENRTVIWSFLPVDEEFPWYDEIKDLKYADITILKELFIKYHGDIRVLSTFEFITPTYIFKNEDLLETKTINELGQKNLDNYQLIAVQGFNVVDIIDNLGYRDAMDSVKHEMDSFMLILRIMTMLILAIMLTLFFKISHDYNKNI